MTYLYLDTETMGLSLLDHDIWELAWAVDDDVIHSGQVPHSRDRYDTAAMTVNNYWKRCTTLEPEGISPVVENELMDTFRFYAGRGTPLTLVGANPAFDAYRLSRRWNWSEPWHYRMIDVSVYAMPIMGAAAPPGLSAVYDWVVAKSGYDETPIPHPDHTAAGDVACTRAVFQALQVQYAKLVEVPF